MNKQVEGAQSSNIENLETELMGQEMSQMQQDVATGRAKPVESQQLTSAVRRRNRHFHIKQGKRRRHPYRTLNQYQALQNTTSGAATHWEQTMMYENKRSQMPREFKTSGLDGGMTTQMGIATLALENYTKSKEKLMRMYLAGV